jgi:hypothetical protein
MFTEMKFEVLMATSIKIAVFSETCFLMLFKVFWVVTPVLLQAVTT